MNSICELFAADVLAYLLSGTYGNEHFPYHF